MSMHGTHHGILFACFNPPNMELLCSYSDGHSNFIIHLV